MMTSQNIVSVQIKLGYREFLDAYRLHRAVATKEKNSHTIIGILLLLLGGSFFAFLLVEPPPNAIDVPFAVVILAIGVLSLFDLFTIAVSWILARLYLQRYPQPYQLTFEEHGIRFRSGTANAMYEWNFYQEAFEGKTVFILMYGKGSYSTIPKSVFQSENEIDMFRDMLKQNLTNFRQE